MASALPKAAMPHFISKPEEYGLYNPSPEAVSLKWSGRSITLPGCLEQSLVPCHFDTGEEIPGSYLVRDCYQAGVDGLIPKVGSAFNWRAAEAIRNLLGIDVETGIAHSTKAARGISFIPAILDKATMEAVIADSRTRWASHEVKWAENEIRTYQSAQELAQRAGTTAPAPDSGYHKAQVILGEHRTRVLLTTSQVDEAVSESDAEEIAGMKVIAIEMAEKAAKGKDIDKLKLAEDLMEDPSVRKHLQKTHSIRKRGYKEEKVK